MKIYWGRILAYGFAFEVLAIFMLAFINARYIKYPISDLELSATLFIGAVIGGLLLTRKLTSHHIVNGALFGVSTILVYMLITVSAEMAGNIKINYDVYYFIKHVVKVLGGALGAVIVINLMSVRNASEAND